MNTLPCTELHPPTAARWLPDLLSRLKCPDCGGEKFSLYYDDSVDLSLADSAAVVCESCHACFPYALGVLNLLPERPDPLTTAQRTNFNALVARFYQSAWRSWSMKLLAGQNFDNAAEAGFVAGWCIDGQTENLQVGVDLGTSHGLYALHLADRMRRQHQNGYVIGVDMSPMMLQYARRRADDMGLADRLIWLIADVEKLPLQDASMSFAADGGTLNEYHDERAALAAVRRVLRSRGVFTAMHLCANGGLRSVLFKAATIVSGLRFPDAKAWQSRFLNAELELLEQRQMGNVLFSRLTIRDGSASD